MADCNHTPVFPTSKSFSFSFPALTSVLFSRACNTALHYMCGLSCGRLSVKSGPLRRFFGWLSCCAARSVFPDVRSMACAGGLSIFSLYGLSERMRPGHALSSGPLLRL